VSTEKIIEEARTGLQIYLSTPTKPVTAKEFQEFWDSLSPKERTQYIADTMKIYWEG